MKRLDRYVLTEMLPPFLFGIGAFLAILVGVQLLYEMLRMIYTAGFPAWAAIRIFLLEIPGTVTLTLPMATMFGSLMAMGRLSGDGEVVAMRAGGTSVPRIGASLIVAGMLISIIGLVVNESVVPPAKNRAFEIARDVRTTAAGEDDFVYVDRDDEGHVERILHAERFDMERLALYDVTVVDYTLGSKPVFYTVPKAWWQGEYWIMRNPEQTIWDENLGGLRSWTVPKASIPVGHSKDEMERIRKGPDDMTLEELREEMATARRREADARADRLWMHYHVRLAIPWASLGFAVLGLALGVHRQRSSRGIGMGVSLLVIFIYYVVAHTLTLVGERGVAHPAIMAWTPNVLLYLTGIGLLLSNSR
ncbi:MAG: LptF/LptG family permease [Armatimonadota bacterium]|nr:LptF/LptG family permease [Armatimonadota bacterium]